MLFLYILFRDITSLTSAPGVAFPVTFVSVFTTFSISIFSSLVLYTSSDISSLSFFPSSFCTIVIVVPLVCLGIGILNSPFVPTLPVYVFVPILTIISLPILPVPLIAVSSFVTAITVGFSVTLSVPSLFNLFSTYISKSCFLQDPFFLTYHICILHEFHNNP